MHATGSVECMFIIVCCDTDLDDNAEYWHECRVVHQKWWCCVLPGAMTRRRTLLYLVMALHSRRPAWLLVIVAWKITSMPCSSSHVAWHPSVLTMLNMLFLFRSAFSLVSNFCYDCCFHWWKEIIFSVLSVRLSVYPFIFTRESSYCFQHVLAIAILSICLSVYLSDTWVEQSKVVQARITKSSPSAAWKTLVLGTVKFFHKF